MSPTFEAEVRAPHGKKSRKVPLLVTQPSAESALPIFHALDPQGSNDTPLSHYRLTQVSR